MAKSKKYNKTVYKTREATLYALWRSIPMIFHQLPKAKLKDMGYDTDDEIFQKLITCRTKSEFREMFGLSWQTVVKWDKNKQVLDMIDDFNLESNVLKFKKDIDYHFTQATIRESDASRVKLWKQVFEGWEEKSRLGVKSESLNELAGSIKKLAEWNGDKKK
jgi:hypothetical protein